MRLLTPPNGLTPMNLQRWPLQRVLCVGVVRFITLKPPQVSWFAVDLGHGRALSPSAYTLRCPSHNLCARAAFTSIRNEAMQHRKKLTMLVRNCQLLAFGNKCCVANGCENRSNGVMAGTVRRTGPTLCATGNSRSVGSQLSPRAKSTFYFWRATRKSTLSCPAL